jgi:hypothetical protein
MAIQRYMVAWTGWVPPVTVRSPSRRGARQAAQTVWGVLEDDGLGAGVAVAIAPLLEGREDRLELLAGVGKPVRLWNVPVVRLTGVGFGSARVGFVGCARRSIHLPASPPKSGSGIVRPR